MTNINSTAPLLLPLLLLLTFSFISEGAARHRDGHMNVIDRCWRRDPLWSENRQRLASCSVGFAGKMRNNCGAGLTLYVVSDASDDPVRPRTGTLRYGTSMIPGKVWITFARDMQIKLEQPLLIGSYTTVDGRGVDVHITGGAGFLLNKVNNVIIHGLQFHHIRVVAPGPVVGPGGKVTNMWGNDGDAIRLVSSSKIWIDHNTLYTGEDGLVDVTRGSTGITISNNWFHDHDKVMLLGHDDGFIEDRNMHVTVVFNRFGPNCNQRMPRIRHGYAHVANNLYEGWKHYAIGGSMNPRVKSEANFFIAPPNNNKAVTWRVSEGKRWSWKSVNDIFVNGAFFGETDLKGLEPGYNLRQRFAVGNAGSVKSLTKFAGTLRCSMRSRC